jgi:peptidoglycan hydrolase CwlO-like protein
MDSKLKTLLIVQWIMIVAVVILAVFLFGKNKKASDEVIVPFKEHINFLDQQIKSLHKQQSFDSVVRLVVLEQIDSINRQRMEVSSEIAQIDRHLSKFEKQYEKVDHRYTGVPTDSIQRLFSGRFH